MLMTGCFYRVSIRLSVVSPSCVFGSVLPYRFACTLWCAGADCHWLRRADGVFVLSSSFVCSDYTLTTSVTSVMYILRLVAFLSWLSSISFLNSTDSVFICCVLISSLKLCTLSWRFFSFNETSRKNCLWGMGTFSSGLFPWFFLMVYALHLSVAYNP